MGVLLLQDAHGADEISIRGGPLCRGVCEAACHDRGSFLWFGGPKRQLPGAGSGKNLLWMAIRRDCKSVVPDDKIRSMNDITQEWTREKGTKGTVTERKEYTVNGATYQTPDYLIDGERFDLKSPIGRGNNLLYGMIAKKKEQSHNFIIDITNCPLSMEELEG